MMIWVCFVNTARATGGSHIPRVFLHGWDRSKFILGCCFPVSVLPSLNLEPWLGERPRGLPAHFIVGETEAREREPEA